LTAIRRTIRLCIPVISANVEYEEEGDVFREWRKASQRSLSIPRRRFTPPVIVDENHDPRRRQQTPDVFKRLDFGHAPGGEADTHVIAMSADEIRAMRWTVGP
jgi:hypothetical protein